MAETAFLQPTRSNGTALAVVIALHGAAITGLALAKMDVVKFTSYTPIELIPINPPKPVEPPPPEPTAQPPVSVPLTIPTPRVPLPPIPEAPIAEPSDVQAVPVTTTAHTITPEPIREIVSPPPPPKPMTVEPARAKANLGSYVSDSDYPAAAIRGEEQGTTRFRLAIGPDGRVANCTVTGTSGSSALDRATCTIMQKRARFTPARDSSGNAVGDSVSSAIRWVLPD